MKEHKIGRKFKMTINGVESDYKLDYSKDYLSCDGCAFISSDGITCTVDNLDLREPCTCEDRSDDTEVIFIKL